ncbi:cyclin-H-like [Oscarella lobularis]|uniref:cyclin-H-like n=1 Tax=Oscarella lobularis TaxID=121494 RepID=UPI003313CC23
MFHSSTQRKHWMFSSVEELQAARRQANRAYVENFSGRFEDFLTAEEESMLCRAHEVEAGRICKDLFRRNVPGRFPVLATTLVFFKRFYANNSVMSHHPRDILYTSLYMACKVEEESIPMDSFVNIFPAEERERIAECILRNELLLLQGLRFHLAVHNSFRPLEGLLIDIKTRSGLAAASVDGLREKSHYFLTLALYSDALFLFAPSQIALAAIQHAAKHVNVDLSGYFSALGNAEQINDLESAIKAIESIVLSASHQNDGSLAKEKIDAFEQKLKRCRDPKFDPESEEFRKRLEEAEEDLLGEPKKLKSQQDSEDSMEEDIELVAD